MTTYSETHSLRLCVDCVNDGLGEGKDLPLLGKDWVLGWDNDAEPHFVNYGSPCDGCGSLLGGDRYDVEGWQPDQCQHPSPADYGASQVRDGVLVHDCAECGEIMAWTITE